MKTKELASTRQKSVADLNKRLVELRKKLIAVAPKIAAGQENNLKQKMSIRNEVAQLLSIMHEKQKGEETKS